MIRCPECSTEIDVDEDEVEEGEILSCPECESELEVSQIHPVHLNIINEDDDETVFSSAFFSYLIISFLNLLCHEFVLSITHLLVG